MKDDTLIVVTSRVKVLNGVSKTKRNTTRGSHSKGSKNSHPLSKNELKYFIIFFLNNSRSNTNIFKTSKYIVIELCSRMDT